MKLTLESRVQHDRTHAETNASGIMMVTPMVTKDYWQFRVRLGKKQAIVGFPKFFTIGIGFQREEDWNTNLPYTSSAADIYEHIKHNKGAPAIRKADCLKAIAMIQEAAKAAKEAPAAPKGSGGTP